MRVGVAPNGAWPCAGCCGRYKDFTPTELVPFPSNLNYKDFALMKMPLAGRGRRASYGLDRNSVVM